MRWEQFLDLLTVAEVMLFIFGRLLMSGSASAAARPGDLTCTPKCPAWKNLRDVPGLVVLTHSALLYNFSCGTRRRPLTLSQSVSLAPPPLSPFSFDSIHFFQPNFFPSLPLHRPPSHPSPDSRIHLLSSRLILACYCFSFRLGRPVFTNGLLPADQCFRLSCINYWSSRMELSRAE